MDILYYILLYHYITISYYYILPIRKLCKITGRRMDDHNFVPLLEFGRRPQCVLCKVTGNGNVKKEMPKVCTVSSP